VIRPTAVRQGRSCETVRHGIVIAGLEWGNPALEGKPPELPPKVDSFAKKGTEYDHQVENQKRCSPR
jgi:hypothetical protein